MAHQMAKEGALWPSVMITLGPCWCKVKLHWANIANVSSTIRCWQLINTTWTEPIWVQVNNLIKNCDVLPCSTYMYTTYTCSYTCACGYLLPQPFKNSSNVALNLQLATINSIHLYKALGNFICMVAGGLLAIILKNIKCAITCALFNLII